MRFDPNDRRLWENRYKGIEDCLKRMRFLFHDEKDVVRGDAVEFARDAATAMAAIDVLQQEIVAALFNPKEKKG